MRRLARPRLGVLISGRGSNLQAIIDAVAAGRLDAEIAIVISNRADAAGLERARAAGIETLVLPHKAYAGSHGLRHRAGVRAQEARGSLVCLAGFMRLLGPAFIDEFPNAVLNIHPSLLPAFPGLDAQRQAFEHGVTITGATVHLVTPDLDAGPILLQAAVDVKDTDTVETLSARILEQEHRIYPEAIALGACRYVARRGATCRAARQRSGVEDLTDLRHQLTRRERLLQERGASLEHAVPHHCLVGIAGEIERADCSAALRRPARPARGRPFAASRCR